jgi:uncharacterized UBP type Zn finger protein
MAEREDELKQLKQDYGITFASKEGERVLADLQSAYYHRGSFVKGDPHETSHREGQRSVLIRIINLLKEDKNG